MAAQPNDRTDSLARVADSHERLPVGCLLVGVLCGMLALPACVPGPYLEAERKAMEHLNQEVEEGALQGLETLRAATSIEEIVAELAKPTHVVDTNVAGHTATWDAVATANAHASGWLTQYERSRPRTCVRYEGAIGRDQVSWQGIECPAHVDRDSQYGPYDSTVTVEPGSTD